MSKAKAAEETTHTPGEWQAESVKQRENLCGRLAIIRSPGLAIVGYANGRDDAERDANAKLFAASPELLAALNMILYAHEATDRNGICTHVPAALEAARAAVKKATGGTADE